MQTKTTNTFKYSELSEQAQSTARDWYRNDGDLGYNWWESVYEDASQAAALVGIDIAEGKHGQAIFFSGFSSQGDGASFEGKYNYRKAAVKAIKAFAPKDGELLRIAKALQEVQRQHFYHLTASAKQRGHYNHSGCMAVEVSHNEDMYRDIGSAEDDVTQLLRDFADWIYKQLENEYEFQISDEQVVDIVESNQYDFDEFGNIA